MVEIQNRGIQNGEIQNGEIHNGGIQNGGIHNGGIHKYANPTKIFSLFRAQFLQVLCRNRLKFLSSIVLKFIIYIF